MITTTDFNLAAARAAHAHLRRLYDGLRAQVIHAWLVENRSHPKAREVDIHLSVYRLQSGRLDALESAEALVERHARA
jgi:hypothetical protein